MEWWTCYAWIIISLTDMYSDPINLVSLGREDDMPSKKGRDASVPWNLQMDSEGWPILPLKLALPLPQLKEILCSFHHTLWAAPKPTFGKWKWKYLFLLQRIPLTTWKLLFPCWAAEKIHHRWIPPWGCAHLRAIQNPQFQNPNIVPNPSRKTDSGETCIAIPVCALLTSEKEVLPAKGWTSQTSWWFK